MESVVKCLIWHKLNIGCGLGSLRTDRIFICKKHLFNLEELMRFPEITGSNLLRRKVTLPDDLQGELKILFIAFQQWHQAMVNSWIPSARQFEQSIPEMKFYEIPVIYKMNFLSQTFINEGMRAGIPNQTTRKRLSRFTWIKQSSVKHWISRTKKPSGCCYWIEKGRLSGEQKALIPKNRAMHFLLPFKHIPHAIYLLARNQHGCSYMRIG